MDERQLRKSIDNGGGKVIRRILRLKVANSSTALKEFKAQPEVDAPIVPSELELSPATITPAPMVDEKGRLEMIRDFEAMEKAAIARQTQEPPAPTEEQIAGCIAETAAADRYPHFPAELKALDRWCVYKLVWNKEKQKHDKPPFDAKTHRKGNPIDPEDRSSFETVLGALTPTQDYNGAGFGLDYSDGLTCVDFDHCVRDGEIDCTIQTILAETSSYAEFSPSGDGVHIWTKGWQVPIIGEKAGCKVGDAEMYSGKHYLTVTGKHIAGTPLTVECRDLSSLYDRIIAGEFKSTAAGKAPTETSTSSVKEPVRVERTGTTITTKLQLLMAGRTVPGSKPFIVSDQHGNSVEYPSQSESDQALCNCLAMELDGDPDRVDEEFRKSSLYREKWERKDYRESTIRRAIESMGKTLSSSVEVLSNTATETDDVAEVAEIKNLDVADMPESVLCGCLGEIYKKRLSAFPVAYGWPSLVTAAGVLVPAAPAPETPGIVIFNGDDQTLTNLYTGLVGPVHSGKSQSIEWGAKALNVYQTTRYTEVKAGSAEGLFKKIKKDRDANTLFDQVLVNLDEWSHFFAKAGIEGASFSRLLTTRFYRRKHSLVIAGGREIEVDCMMSWIGGIVTEQYEECFNSATIGGLYDRFVHGLCPTGYTFDYIPFEGGPEIITPVSVTVDGSVWEVAKVWRKENPALGREIELAVRVAKICASIDGREVLRGEDLELHKTFTEYQFDVRKRLKPNPGDNPDAVFSNAVLSWLETHAPNGEWVSLRDLKRGISYNRMRLGPGVADRAINNLARFGDVEFSKTKPGVGRPGQYIRIISGREGHNVC